MPVSSSAVLAKPSISVPSPLIATLIASGDRGGASPGPTTIVTSSVSPGADCALVLMAGGTVNNAGTISLFDNTLTTTSSGSGPTWTRQAYGAGPTSGGYKTAGAVFTAVIGGSNPGAFTVTIDFNASVEAWNYGWALYKVVGYNTTTPFTGAVGTKEQAANHSAVTVTLPATPTAEDITLALSVTNTNAGAPRRVPGTTFSSTYGYWAIDATSDTTKDVGWSTGQRTGSTSTTVQFSDTVSIHYDQLGYDSGQTAINLKALSPRPAPSALTATLLHTGEMDWDDTPINSFTTPSITPGTNCALVLLASGVTTGYSNSLFIDNTSSNAAVSILSSTGTPYWTKQAYGVGGGVAYNGSGVVFTTLISGTDPGTFTVTVTTMTGNTAGALAWGLYKVTGHDPGYPFAGPVATFNQAGNGAVTPVLTATPASGDITLAISQANVASTGSTPGATFGSTYGTWTANAVSNGTQKNAWVIGQRTGSTSTNVQFSDVNAHNSDSYSSGQAAIIVKDG